MTHAIGTNDIDQDGIDIPMDRVASELRRADHCHCCWILAFHHPLFSFVSVAESIQLVRCAASMGNDRYVSCRRDPPLGVSSTGVALSRHPPLGTNVLIEMIRNAGVVIGDAAFIRVGRIIGSGWHVYECCRGSTTIVHPMYDLWWDGQKDLVGLASINDVKGAARRAADSNIVKNDLQVSVRERQPIRLSLVVDPGANRTGGRGDIVHVRYRYRSPLSDPKVERSGPHDCLCV